MDNEPLAVATSTVLIAASALLLTRAHKRRTALRRRKADLAQK